MENGLTNDEAKAIGDFIEKTKHINDSKDTWIPPTLDQQVDSLRSYKYDSSMIGFCICSLIDFYDKYKHLEMKNIEQETAVDFLNYVIRISPYVYKESKELYQEFIDYQKKNKIKNNFE